MKNICGFNAFSSTDLEQFYKMLSSVVEKFQGDGAEVEVQYSTVYTGGSTICHSALVLGRK